MALVLAFLVGWLLIAGCGAEPVPPESDSGEVVSPQIDPAPSQIPDQELIPEPVETAIDDSVILPSVANSLTILDSYRYSWELSFEGVNHEGLPLSWHVGSQVTSVSEPQAERIEVSTSGFESSPELSKVSIVQAEGRRFFEIEGVGCLSGDGQSSVVVANDLTDPDSLLAGLSTRQQISIGEMMRGLRVNQYSLDEASLPSLEGYPVTAEGTVFFTQSDGIPTQVKLVATGQNNYLSSGQAQDGTLTLVFEVNDLNQPLSVEIPEACRGSSIYPMVQDASQITVLEDLTGYQTALPVIEVVAFYQQEMPLGGWSEAEEALVLEDMALMSYERDNVLVVIAIDSVPGEAATSVLITP